MTHARNGGVTRWTACSITTSSARRCGSIRAWSSTASAGSARSCVEYGGTNPVQASNLQPVGWTLDAWSLGADGVLPWQTIGTARSWQQGDELSLFYPLPDAGRGAGRLARSTSLPGAELGVVPSIG